MQFNKTTEYAIRAVIYLATHQNIEKMENIAESMDIPKAYLVKVLRKLKQHNIVRTHQGVNGGFELNISMNQIRMYDIMKATERTLKLNSCVESGTCALSGDTKSCKVGAYGFYCQLQNLFEEKIKEVTVADLVTNPKTQQEV